MDIHTIETTRKTIQNKPAKAHPQSKGSRQARTDNIDLIWLKGQFETRMSR